MKRREYAFYVYDRNAAFLSMDARQIVAHCRRYGIAVPENPMIFWAGVHKARLMIEDFPAAEREKSREWLMDHGFYQDAHVAVRGRQPAVSRVYRHASRLQNLRESLSFHFGRLTAAIA